MEATIKEMTKKNIAKRLGVSNYADLVKAGVEEEKVIVARAAKKMKAKKLNTPHYFSSGSPYIMLGLKINSKGKRVK